jgi:hypothetical protein
MIRCLADYRLEWPGCSGQFPQLAPTQQPKAAPRRAHERAQGRVSRLRGVPQSSLPQRCGGMSEKQPLTIATDERSQDPFGAFLALADVVGPADQ